MASFLYALTLEKQFLSACLRRIDVLAEIPFINEQDFGETNRVVFSMMKVCAGLDTPFSKYVLIDKLVATGIKIGGILDPAVYIESLDAMSVPDTAAEGIAQQLRQWTTRRKAAVIGQRIQTAATEKTDKPKSATELVAEITSIFNKEVNLLAGGNGAEEPKDLYGTIGGLLENESTFDTKSVPSPFELYNDLYGYFDPGNVYCWVARMKVGKSSFALSLLQQIALLHPDFRALLLDTEMSTEELQCRALSSVSGVKEFHIRHKIYRKHKEMRDRIDEAYEKLRPLWARVEHLYIGGWTLETQLSATRRWAFKRLKNGERGMAVLDYFKLNSTSDFKSKNPLFMTIGEKVDAYKNLAKELGIPIGAFCQANREGEDSKIGDKMRNSSVVGGSDMIAQFCSNIYLLERLSAEERAFLNQTGPDGATHSMRLLAPRQLGPNEMGKDCVVKYEVPIANTKRMVVRYTENYICLSMKNFRFQEVGTFKDLYERSRILGIKPQENNEIPEPVI